MGKGPVHLVFGVAVNQGYRTVFGMEKIDQGRHEGALTLDPTHETAYRARSHLVSKIFFVSKVVRDLLPGFTGPSPRFNLVGKRDQLALERFPWHLGTYFYLLSLSARPKGEYW